MKLILIVLNLVFALGILAWPLAAFSSIFFFDAPGSSSNLITVALAISVLGYPIPTILGNVAFWINRKKESLAKLARMTALSGSGYVCILVCWLLLDFVCEGKFAC